jgi:hypothetical protein
MKLNCHRCVAGMLFEPAEAFGGHDLDTYWHNPAVTVGPLTSSRSSTVTK